MKNHRRITMGVAFAVLLAMLACGCQKKPLPNQGQEQQEQPKGPYFRFMLGFPDEVVLNMDSGAQSWTVETDITGWTATTEASWLKVERRDGATLKVTSTARPDSETAARSATVKVYVTSDEFNSSSFTVKDAPAYVDGDGFDYGEHTDWD